MWTGSLKRCWHYSLWSEARKHSFMCEVGFLHEDAHKELYAAAIFVNFPCMLQLFHFEIYLTLFCAHQCEASRNKDYWLRICMHGKPHCIFLYSGIHSLSKVEFYENSCFSYNYLALTLYVLPVFVQSRYYRSPEVLLGYQYPNPWN